MQLTLSRFLEEDHILMAMHRHECAWGDLLDDFKDWKQQVADLCAPTLNKMAAATAAAFPETKDAKKIVSFVADSTPNTSRVNSPLFMDPIIVRSAAPSPTPQNTYFTTDVSIVPASQPSLPKTIHTIKTIIARNLPRTISVKELYERFQLYGVVRDVYLPMNKDVNSVHYGTLRGFALIKYETAAQSDRAIRVLSVLGLTIRGKQVTVELAKSDTATRT